ncbi:MAG: hypothetical protein ISP91_11365 [Pseudomonadales bacterium]|jgi:hypothetical protein|nr:hypothetical protein [Pseudomonadales bacterium]
MVYLIIGLALLFIIVPIVAVLPSARQKERMQMRTIARQSGVSVDLTSIEDPNPRQDKYVTHTGRRIPPKLKVTAWRVQRKRERDWRQLPEVNWCVQRMLDKSWRWSVELPDEASDELKNWLNNSIESLPNDVDQVEESRYTITVYWHEAEKGSEQIVLDFLRQCADLPLNKPVEEDEG